jgi:putative membrane protein
VSSSHTSDPSTSGEPATWRAFVGGFLMGLANLVPGVSGGTMILSLGLYDRFIAAIAELTSLRWTRETLVFMGVLAVGLFGAILSMSGPAVWLVSEHRWIAYSLFIGLTLGGVPELLKLCKGGLVKVAASASVGLGLMIWLALSGARTVEPSLVNLLWVGALAASSMILPGVSGSLLLLIFGLYSTVIGSISLLKSQPVEAIEVLGPVAVGAALGIGVLANVLKRALERAPRVSHGLLLGLLVGSVVGLYPFQESVHPELSKRESRKAVQMLVVDDASIEEIEAAYAPGWEAEEVEALRAEYGGRSASDLKRLSLELERFSPGLQQVLTALGLLAGGAFLTGLMSRGGRKGTEQP